MVCFDESTAEKLNTFTATTINILNDFSNSVISRFNDFSATTINVLNNFSESIIVNVNNFSTSTITCYVIVNEYWTIHTDAIMETDTGVLFTFREG